MLTFKVVKMWPFQRGNKLAGCNVDVCLEATGEYLLTLQGCGVWNSANGPFAAPMSQFKYHSAKFPGDCFKKFQQEVMKVYQEYKAGTPAVYSFGHKVEFMYRNEEE